MSQEARQEDYLESLAETTRAVLGDDITENDIPAIWRNEMPDVYDIEAEKEMIREAEEDEEKESDVSISDIIKMADENVETSEKILEGMGMPIKFNK